MAKPASSSLARRLFAPRGMTDPEMTFIAMEFGKILVSASFVFTGVLLFFLPAEGFGLARKITILWMVMNACTILISRMGFFNFARYYYFTYTTLTVFAISQIVGFSSCEWVYFLQFPSGTFFLTTPKEKYFRNYTYMMCAIGFVCCFVFYGFNVVPAHIPIEHMDAVIRFGVFNVCWAGFSMLIMVIGYQREVAEFKAKLEQRSVAMVQQAKMSTLGEMAAGVAHEINNPLGVIIGKIEVLERRAGDSQIDSAKILYDFGRIKVVVQRISKIINALRTYARNAENDPFVHSNVQEVIAETLQLWKENLNDHSIEIRISGEPNIEFQGRPVQISQALGNLLSNAYDAVLNLPEKWIEVRVDRLDAEKFRISVTDGGPGVPHDIVEKIMQPFFTTKEIGKGTGLGLSVAQGIAENHGGRLYLNRESANTQFVIELPFKHESSPTTVAA